MTKSKAKAENTAPASAGGYVPRLKRHYLEAVRAELQKQFSYANPMRVPEITKVVLNMGIGEATADRKKVEQAARDMTFIAGQKPVMTKARKSIANFKLREGRAIGAKVTLRGDRMWNFLDRLMNIVLPRVRDFRGVSSDAFDGRGNYTLGLREQLIFPEIEYDKIDKVRGMEITIVTNAPSDAYAAQLLQMLGMPFRKG